MARYKYEPEEWKVSSKNSPGLEDRLRTEREPSRIRKHFQVAAVILLVLTPLFLDALYTWERAPRIPFRDQLLASMRIAVKASDGEIGISDLWKQHNEHRIFFTRLLTAGLARWAHWDLRLQAAVSILICFTILLILALLLHFPKGDRSAPLMLFTAWFLLPMRLWAIWQNSFLNQHLFAVLFLLMALFSLQRMKRGVTALLVAALWCFCATISVGTGLTTWFAIGTIFLLRRDRSIREILLWAALTAVSIEIYFYNFRLGGHNPMQGTLLHKLAYFLTFLGNPFVDTMSQSYLLATLMGAIGLGIWALLWFVLLRKHEADWETLLFLPPGLFALASAFLATLSRSYIGCIQALFSHYVLYSALLWISLAAAASRILFIQKEKRTLKILQSVLIILLIPLAGLYAKANYKAWHSPSFVTPELENCFRNYPTSGDASCLEGLHRIFEKGSPEAHRRKNLLRRIRQLAKRRLTVFHDESLISMDPNHPESTPAAVKNGK